MDTNTDITISGLIALTFITIAYGGLAIAVLRDIRKYNRKRKPYERDH